METGLRQAGNRKKWKIKLQKRERGSYNIKRLEQKKLRSISFGLRGNSTCDNLLKFQNFTNTYTFFPNLNNKFS